MEGKKVRETRRRKEKKHCVHLNLWFQSNMCASLTFRAQFYLKKVKGILSGIYWSPRKQKKQKTWMEIRREREGEGERKKGREKEREKSVQWNLHLTFLWKQFWCVSFGLKIDCAEVTMVYNHFGFFDWNGALSLSISLSEWNEVNANRQKNMLSLEHNK